MKGSKAVNAKANNARDSRTAKASSVSSKGNVVSSLARAVDKAVKIRNNANSVTDNSATVSVRTVSHATDSSATRKDNHAMVNNAVVD